MHRIFLVQTKPASDAWIADTLREEGYLVSAACYDDSLVAELIAAGADLLILQAATADAHTAQLVARLCEQSCTGPMVVLASQAGAREHAMILDAGANDVVHASHTTIELLARIRAHLRSRRAPAPDVVCFGDVSIDLVNAIVRRAGREVYLARREYQLLTALAASRGRIIAKEELLRTIWQCRVAVRTRTVEYHIKELRRKLEANPAIPSYIQTIPRRGYRLTCDLG
jgi:two-component system KDP operon response regulator KdpE